MIPDDGQGCFVEVMERLCRAALADGRTTLLEPELYAVLRAGGVATPEHFTVDPRRDVRSQVRPLPGDRVVVKVVSPGITHKTEVGGVRVVPNEAAAIADTVASMLATVRERAGDEVAASIRSFLVAGRIQCDGALGSQFFAGLRHSPDMGPVLAFGFGGLDAEEMAVRFAPGQGMVLASPELLSPDAIIDKLARSYAYRRVTGRTREARRFAGDEAVASVVRFFHALATRFSNRPETGIIVTDFEVNPFFATGGRLVAVDAFLRFREGVDAERAAPAGQMRRLLEPRTAAIMGASSRGMNPGRIILRNLLRDGFPPEGLRAIHPDGGEIDGIPCCRSISDLPFDADLLVVAVGARAVPGILDEVVRTRKAQSVVLIPGGMEETEEGKETARLAREAFFTARREGRFTPVLVGPNTLGVRSRPGRYDTMFIPTEKLPLPRGVARDLAIVSQSGAFLVTRMSDLPVLDPRYAISTGNQMDLTLVDFVEVLLDDPEVRVFGLYVEGFALLDGLRLARLVRRGRETGRDFVVYKAGRTAAGLGATASHTASISGDWASCVEVLADAGALIAESFEEFNDLLVIASMSGRKRFGGKRIAAMSNAGFESVGLADNLRAEDGFELPQPSVSAERLSAVLRAHGLSSLVNLRNPFDLNPMAPDSAYLEILRICLEAPGVDALVAGIVPLTSAMKTLPPGADPAGVDTIEAPDSLAVSLPALVAGSDKPVISVVDSGRLYDPLAGALLRAGVPCFRSADTAMRAFQRYIAYRVDHRTTGIG